MGTAMNVDLKKYKTRARFIDMVKRVRLDEDNAPLQGNYLALGTNFRFVDGRLHGVTVCDDSHAEHYVEGVLHRDMEEGPAVSNIMEGHRYWEYWEHGTLIEVVYPTGEVPDDPEEEYPPLP